MAYGVLSAPAANGGPWRSGANPARAATCFSLLATRFARAKLAACPVAVIANILKSVRKLKKYLQTFATDFQNFGMIITPLPFHPRCCHADRSFPPRPTGRRRSDLCPVGDRHLRLCRRGHRLHPCRRHPGGAAG